MTENALPRHPSSTGLRAENFLDYNPLTGIFVWKVSPARGVKVGSVAGTLSPKGYIKIGFAGRIFLAHRLAWLFTYEELPDNIQVDHKDGDTANNRIDNLRLATHGQNKANSRASNELNIKGVYRSKNKFVAKINVKGYVIYLGSFPTKEEAHAAYLKAAQEHFGEFARGT